MMESNPEKKNPGKSDWPPGKRRRSQSITSGVLQPDFIPHEGTSHYQRMNKNSRIDILPHSATIHGVLQKTRASFFDDIFTLTPSLTIHALKPRKASHLDELTIGELGRLRSLSDQVSAAVPPTPLVSERMVRMQMLDQYLSQRGADLVTTADVPSSRFFNFSFHRHLIDELKKISKTSDKHWFYWYVHILFKYTGLKHIALSLLLIGYTFLGGAVFEKLEHGFEREATLNRGGASVMAEISAFASTINQTAIVLSHAKLTAQMTEFYARLRDIDGGLVSSLDRLDPGNATWTFQSATFYAMTLLSTIGYGI